MRRSVLYVAAVVALVFVWGANADIINPSLFADVRPNTTAWKTATLTDVADGTYNNMAAGTYANTLTYHPTDAIVYSTGDGGKRLWWFYAVPNATTSGLNGLFQVRDVFDWDGEEWTYNWSTGTSELATADNGWVTPTSWEERTVNGQTVVVGGFGDAFWAWDDLALPHSTDASPYNETDQADIDALVAEMNQYNRYWRGEIRYRDSIDDPWTVQSLTLTNANATAVPLPSAALGGLAAMALVGVVRRNRSRAA